MITAHADQEDFVTLIELAVAKIGGIDGRIAQKRGVVRNEDKVIDWVEVEEFGRDDDAVGKGNEDVANTNGNCITVGEDQRWFGRDDQASAIKLKLGRQGVT